MTTAKPAELVRSTNVIDRCVTRLREAIMIGEMRPGHKVIEADLCQQLGVSRASLREALRALEAAKLLEFMPNRGFSVARLGEQEIEDIHDAWALLTGETVHRFTRLATSKQLAHLTALCDALQNALPAGKPLGQLDATNGFFAYIAEQCGNPILRDMIRLLVSRINFLRVQSLLYDGWRELCVEEIDAIKTAICAQKPDAARQAALKHIESACSAARNVAAMPRSEPSGRARGAAR
jgi:DNA-binding GntR family transcriptional regulator